MPSSTEGLELAQLAFYVLTSLPAIYCLIRHGRIGLLGWIYVFAMCGLRLVGNGIAYHSLSTTGEPNRAASIISGIGLSPLLLAALGILHEANHSIQSTLPAILSGFGMLIPHIVIGGGIGLAAASGSHTVLLKVGLIVFATGWSMVVALVLVSAKANATHRRLGKERKVWFATPISAKDSSNESNVKLLFGIMIALPLIGIRLIYAIVVAFKYGSPSGGSLAVEVIFGTLPEFLVMITYLSAGIVTRNLASGRNERGVGPAYDSAYVSV
ncbi:hypothetical protein N7532_010547 [Penicillium argentinense]|uniref:DUF7702 domain-containing protein n=1 Tax=Penicillium argentinense TaxID=1131581 RepID=A0A9W9EPW4_9EURO|nr:uncharacterized protein N7532_010547 [Penicillium argentinense]KAJ5085776.1 hypothetical protein N7532_010547 [Penicillium argentinense]